MTAWRAWEWAANPARKFAAIRRRHLPRAEIYFGTHMRAIYCPSPKSGQIIRGTHAAINCGSMRAEINFGTRKKDSPFPRRRESHPKLAAKEIPAYAGMERQRQKQKLNTAQIFRILDSRLRGNDGKERGGGGKITAAKLRRRELRMTAKRGGGNLAAAEKSHTFSFLAD